MKSASVCCARASKLETPRIDVNIESKRRDGEDNWRRGVGSMRHSTSKSTSPDRRAEIYIYRVSTPLIPGYSSTRNAFKNYLYESPCLTIPIVRFSHSFSKNVVFFFLCRFLFESFVSSTFVFRFRSESQRSG